MFIGNSSFSCVFGIPAYDRHTVDGRSSYAQYLSEHMCYISESIPELRSDELKWLKNELASKNQNRQSKALHTKEYAQRELKEKANIVCEKLKKIEDQNYNVTKNITGDTTPNILLNYEAIWWLDILEKFTDSEFHQHFDKLWAEDLVSVKYNSRFEYEFKGEKGRFGDTCYFQGNNITTQVLSILHALANSI